MEIPIYFSFKDFENNFDKDFKVYQEKFVDCSERDFLNDVKSSIKSGLKNVSFIEMWKIGVSEPPYLTLSEFESLDINDEILKEIKVANNEGYDFEKAKKIKYSFEKIIEFIDNKLNNFDDETTKTFTTKINSKLTNIQAIGFLFTKLIENNLIEPKKKNGKISPVNIARMILDHFYFEDLEEQPNEEDLRKALFDDNKLSEDKAKLIKLPTLKQLNVK